ncbi:MAG: thioredoxin [Anaerolineae bacterium]|nr:thioredoxin [Anaerolineae bacterium]
MTTKTMSNVVIEVSQQTFATDVLERSKTTPVIVDFWAEWCGPCRILGPVLERLAEEYAGKFILAKIDVDQNQAISMQYRIQGIPAVKAFHNGKMVGEFTGALPEPQVRKFIEGLIPSGADLLAKQAYDWEMSGQLPMAVANYRQALAEVPDHYHAMVGLGRTLIKQGEVEQGVAVLEGIPLGLPERAVADALIATAEFQQEAAKHSEPDLLAKIEADPADVASRYSLGSLYVVAEKYEAALSQFLEVVRRDRTYKDDGARKAMLALFTTLGDDHQLTKDYRRHLANALF